MAGDAIQARVFISYSRADQAAAQRIRDALNMRGFEAFLDVHDIAPAEDWRRRLGALIRSAEKIVFLISPDSVASKICDWEVNHAEKLGKPVIPLVIRETPVEEVPDRLSRLNFIFFRKETEQAAALKAIESALTIDLAWEREKTRISNLAEEWNNSGRPHHLLTWRDDAIRALEVWRDEHPQTSHAPTETQLAFIFECRRRFTIRQRWIRSALATGLTVMTSLVVVAVFLGLQSEERRVEAVSQRQIAQKNFATAESALSTLLINTVKNLEDIQGVQPAAVLRIMGEVQKGLEILGTNDPDNSRIRLMKAEAFLEIGDVLVKTGLAEKGLSSYQRGLQIVRSIDGDRPHEINLKNLISSILLRIGDIHIENGNSSNGLIAHKEGVELLRQIADAFPKEKEARYNLGRSLLSIGVINFRTGDTESALLKYEESTEILSLLVYEFPEVTDYRNTLASARRSMARAHVELGDKRRAAAEFLQVKKIAESLVSREPENKLFQRNLGLALLEHGEELLAWGAGSGAYQAIKDGHDILRALSNAEPDNTTFKYDLSLALLGVGAVLEHWEDNNGANLAYRNSFEIILSLYETEPQNIRFQNQLSVALQKIGDFKLGIGLKREAREAFEESLAINKSLSRAEPNNIVLLRNLITSYERMASFDPSTNWCAAARLVQRLENAGKLATRHGRMAQRVRSNCAANESPL